LLGTVIDLIAEGLSNKEIAQRLNIATYTVKSRVHNIFEKIGVALPPPKELVPLSSFRSILF
jgi:DNA-directed RNA polymerase specialized sigma24 family protein